MKSFNRTFLIALSAITGGIAVGAVGLGDTSNVRFDDAALLIGHEVQEPKSYIIQGTDSENLAAVVEKVGGNVSREFPIINAISAVLTPKQAEKIKQLGNVRVQDDRQVLTMNGNSVFNFMVSSTAKKNKIDNHIARHVNADKLHDIGLTGQGVTVAVVDSGANFGGNIGANLFRNTSGSVRIPVKYDAFTSRVNFRFNDDQNGHGTHVSNIIANSLMSENNKFNGIAPDVNLLPVKAFNHKGESSYSKVLDALNWIFVNRYQYNIRVVNLSLGAEVQSRYWQDPINQAVMRLWDAGIVVVTSAGNNGKDMGISVPGNNPYVITVGATTDNYTPFDPADDRVTSFSSKGPTYEGFVKPEIVAPGARIAVKMQGSLIAKAMRKSATGIDYSEISGTSQASAVVAGVAALIIQNDPFITPDNVKCKIVATAKAAKVNGNLAFSPFKQGAGIVNAYDAVMSQASDCANQGLNIVQDLMGIKHFFGPVVKAPSGELQILLPSGGVLTEGSHWSTGDIAVEGSHWTVGNIGLEGSHWLQGTMGLEGSHWAQGMMGLEGAHWSTGDLVLEGAHWTAGQVGLEGSHWTQGGVGLEGAHWMEGTMGLEGSHWGEGMMAIESEVGNLPPIDPNAEITIDESVWQ
ncbi:S8 family peptidase [Glaciecola sp. SC05]|uniref:S8 family peptidase n=1 Tax=Glaciecola sp. SC05 TaxID=1987355 RepID=UPI003526FAFE